jgi:hypothetical protein
MTVMVDTVVLGPSGSGRSTPPRTTIKAFPAKVL